MQTPGLQFLQEFTKKNSYSQTGTDIPTFSVGQSAEGGFGTGVKPYYSEQISASPSFDLTPDIDDPIVDQWIKQYRNQPGYKPPGPSLPQLRRNINQLRSTLKPV